MRRIGRAVLFIMVVFVLLLNLTTGTTLSHEKDVEGSEDHPLISRFPGSEIIYHEVTELEEYVLPLAGLDDDGELVDTKRVKGDLTRIQYKAPEDSSTFELYQNYETALKDAGFEILFSGTDKELHWNWTRILYLSGDANKPLPSDVLEENLLISEDDFRYLSAELVEEDMNDIYVALCVALGSRADGPGIQLDVIETREADLDKIEVRTDTLARKISSRGAMAIHDIYFDTDKAELKPESEPALAEIAAFLKQETELRLYVVGHTDSTGDFKYNMELSQNRAEAVVVELVNEYNISADRLKAYGVGPLSPAASNETEEGRAHNRRVELVKQ